MVFGSFLNVCIARIPEGLSVVSPGSRCPRCLTPIKPYDNVPVLGWLWLRGRCRSCGQPISAMYPLVELATGLLFVGCFLRFGLTIDTAKWIVFSCLIVVLAITDLRVRLLPDVVNWPGFAVGLLFSALAPPGDGAGYLFSVRVFHRVLPEAALGVLDGLLGAAFGSLLLLGAATAYRVVRGREGMGMGDVKMMAFVGAFLGLKGAFWTILLGTLLGSLIGVAVVVGVRLAGWTKHVAERASRRGLGPINQMRWAIASRYQLPLGTFLGIGALAVVFLLMPSAAPIVRLR
jgi:leader peptidase (prepilin peptidase)/N-methyltransferase